MNSKITEASNNLKEVRIELVHFSSLPGGIEVILPDIIKNLPQYSFSSFVLRPPVIGKPNVYNNTRVRITYGSFSNLIAGIKLYRYAFKNRRSIFHVFNIGPLFLLILRYAGVKKLVYSIHGTKYWSNSVQKFFLRQCWRMAMSKHFVVTSNSNFSRTVFRKEVLPDREVSVLFNPMDMGRFRPLPDKVRSSVPWKIVYCGRLDRGKNLDVWIKIAAAIHQHFPFTTFDIYGDGPEYGKIERLIFESGQSEYIALRGYTKTPEKVFQSADLMMFLSQYESFGNVVIESILCGTPVIAGSIPSMKEIFSEYPEFLVDLNEVAEERVLLKLQDLEKLSALAENARKSFMKMYDSGIHFSKLGKIYSVYDSFCK